MNKNLIIGTAGHIDHGKTTLIKTLTGTDTDRLAAEEERGISIELGFASLELDNMQVGIIDVPGHEKFIKNMLAGAGGIDLALLVVAADEGIMPQTEEHLAILDILGVEEGVVVVTKIDLVEDEWLELVMEEIKEELSNTFLKDAPIIPIAAIEGEGIGRLKLEIRDLIDRIPNKDKDTNVYCPIDRVFSISGHGTIVTGTLAKGKINLGDQLKLYPKGFDVRVRSLQVHNSNVETVFPGQRVGINLSNVDKAEVTRGDVLATADTLSKSKYLDARLKILSNAPMVLNHGDRIRLHLGAKEILARVYILDRTELYPGEEALVQFKLEEDIVANFKEKYVLRRYSPMTTIGGGEILAPKSSSHCRFDEEVIKSLEVRESGSLGERVELSLKLAKDEPLNIRDLIKDTSLAANQLEEVLTRLKELDRVIEFKIGSESRWVHIDYYQCVKNEVISHLDTYHQEYHLRLGISKEELRTKLFMNLDPNEYNLILEELVAEEKIVVEEASLRLIDFQLEYTIEEERIKDKIINILSLNKFTPPKVDELLADFGEIELAEEVLNSLIMIGDLLALSPKIYFIKEAILEAEHKLIEHLIKEGEISLAEFRNILDSSRKYTLLLLNYFDQQGITKRIEDQRVLK